MRLIVKIAAVSALVLALAACGTQGRDVAEPPAVETAAVAPEETEVVTVSREESCAAVTREALSGALQTTDARWSEVASCNHMHVRVSSTECGVYTPPEVSAVLGRGYYAYACPGITLTVVEHRDTMPPAQ